MSTFLARASTRVISSADYDHLMHDLARHPKMRDLGWAGTHYPQHDQGGHTLGIGNPHSEHGHIIDKSVRDATHAILEEIGWKRGSTGERRHWSYSHNDHPVSLRLQWSLGKPLNTTDHSLGKHQYPIKYAELFVNAEQHTDI